MPRQEVSLPDAFNLVLGKGSSRALLRRSAFSFFFPLPNPLNPPHLTHCCICDSGSEQIGTTGLPRRASSSPPTTATSAASRVRAACCVNTPPAPLRHGSGLCLLRQGKCYCQIREFNFYTLIDRCIGCVGTYLIPSTLAWCTCISTTNYMATMEEMK
jgi:hypothetical protein